MNFLVILTDQFRFDAMGCSGNPVVQTPNLDRLAADGIRFTEAYTEVPVCVPARAGLMTGQYPYRLGTFDNHPVSVENQPTLPRLLRSLGFATMGVGKMHFFPRRAHLGFDRMELSEGLVGHVWDDDYACFMQAKGYAVRREMHGPGHPHVDGSSIHSTYYKPGTLPYPDAVSATAWVADRTCDFIEANRDRPFFCFSSFIKPHPPLLPAEPYDRLYDPATVDMPATGNGSTGRDPLLVAQSRFKGVIDPQEADVRAMRSHYYGLVTQVDHHIGRILNALDANGLREDTVVVFTSDHGELLGDHGYWGKRSFYEGSVKIPLLFRGPGVAPRGGTCNRVVGLTDILPTLVDLAGGDVPEAVSGRSLTPLLGDPEAPWHNSRFGVYGGFRGVVEIDDPRISASFMMRWDNWKYVYHVNGGTQELFDLAGDPHEVVNAARQRPHLCATARHLLAQHLATEALSDYVIDGELLSLPYQAEFQEVVIPPPAAHTATA